LLDFADLFVVCLFYLSFDGSEDEEEDPFA